MVVGGGHRRARGRPPPLSLPQVSDEEAALAAARLKVKRGLPLRDLSGARGLPE